MNQQWGHTLGMPVALDNQHMKYASPSGEIEVGPHSYGRAFGPGPDMQKMQMRRMQMRMQRLFETNPEWYDAPDVYQTAPEAPTPEAQANAEMNQAQIMAQEASKDLDFRGDLGDLRRHARTVGLVIGGALLVGGIWYFTRRR